MVVWVQNPFDSLPGEGSRKMRYWLMCEAFARAGHRVVFWTSDFSHATKRARSARGGKVEEWKRGKVDGGSGLTSLTTPDFEVKLIPTRPYSCNVSFARVRSHRAYARAWLRLAADEAARAKPDLVVASIPTISGAAAARALGHRYGAKVVVDVQDAWPETFERLVPRFILWPLRRAARRVYRDADLVTGVSARYRDLTCRPDFYLAYHGIEVEKLNSENVEKLGEDSSNNLSTSHCSTVPPFHLSTSLLYIGNLGRTYDLATVVRAVEANDDFTLDVAGFGDFASTCPRVRFHGLLAASALEPLLASAAVGVVPMASDSWVGVPNKFLDYARAGLPIVSSLGGETEALLAKYRSGVPYRAGDAASFADAVRRAAALDRGDVRRMCAEVFDAKKIYDNYVKHVTRTLFP